MDTLYKLMAFLGFIAFVQGSSLASKVSRMEREKRDESVGISKRNDFGIKDLTAFNAVMQIKTNGKAAIDINIPAVCVFVHRFFYKPAKIYKNS